MNENKTSKYFKYAIGEIILVVIGILIALQINNWNEDKKDQKKVVAYAKNLVSDIKGDIKETEGRISSLKWKIAYIDTIGEYYRGKKIKNLDNLESLYTIYDNYGYKPFNWYRGTIDEIKSSGGLKLIKNDSLRLLINQYYALTDHLNQDYLEDFEISEALNKGMARIINTNYHNRKDLIDTLNISYFKKDKSIYLNSKVYKEAKILNLKLLTNDINDINVFVNDLFRYKVALSTRYKKEFPKLVERGKKIVKMLEEEYY